MEFVPQLLPPTEILDASWKPQKAHSMIMNFLAPQESMSPLARLIPHRFKHGDVPALPYKIGAEAHVDGFLCEILQAEWETQQEQDDGMLPIRVQVRKQRSPPAYLHLHAIHWKLPTNCPPGRFSSSSLKK